MRLKLREMVKGFILWSLLHTFASRQVACTQDMSLHTLSELFCDSYACEAVSFRCATELDACSYGSHERTRAVRVKLHLTAVSS